MPLDSGLMRGRRGQARKVPEGAFVKIPDDPRDLARFAKETIEVCRDGVGQRLEYYRFLNLVTESGRKDGTKSLVNLCYTFLDRLAAHLFSPVDIRFQIDFENAYDRITEARAARVARLVEHTWGTKTGILFSKGVFEALKFGLMIMKQKVDQIGPNRLPVYRSYLIKPWQFGVYRPDIANLDEQPAMCESVPLTLPELWRRIWMLPNATALYEQVQAMAAKGGGNEVANNFNHPVLISNQIQFTQPLRPLAGGVVGINSQTMFSGLRADIAAPSVMFNELWVWDENDYTTIQTVSAPGGGGDDILIAPRMKKSNLLVSGGMDSCLHPYTMIQPNSVDSNIWGRSELHDLYELQDWLSVTADDIKRLLGLQVDKILAFTGDGLTDETYGNMRQAGYANLGPGGGVNDLTPKFPPEALGVFAKIIEMMEMISGFDNLLSGKGEPGVRSGAQANPLMRTAGARLKDRTLEVETQCADAADLRLALMEYKDGRSYWTDPDKIQETSFLLSDLPEDRRVVVDGHSTSPVFSDDHMNLTIGGLKLGIVDKESAVEMLPYPNKDVILQRLRDKERKEQELLAKLEKTDPEGFSKALEKGIAGGRRR